jgi:hypothetical protein
MTKPRISLVTGAVIALLVSGLAFEIVTTQPVRGAMRTCAELFAIANQLERVDPMRPEERSRLLAEASERCSARFRRSNPLVAAPEGGLVGIPRFIHKNFKAWRQGSNVWVCPRDRFGLVYQFIFEDGRWRFDGLVGELRPGGQMVRSTESVEASIE